MPSGIEHQDNIINKISRYKVVNKISETKVEKNRGWGRPKKKRIKIIEENMSSMRCSLKK